MYDAHHEVFEPKNMSIEELQITQMKGHQAFYSRKKLIKRLLRFEWNALLIGIYARQLNRNWKKKNRTWLKALNLLKPSFDFKVSVDFKQLVSLPKISASQMEKKKNQLNRGENLENIGTQMSL